MRSGVHARLRATFSPARVAIVYRALRIRVGGVEELLVRRDGRSAVGSVGRIHLPDVYGIGLVGANAATCERKKQRWAELSERKRCVRVRAYTCMCEHVKHVRVPALLVYS